MGASSRSTGCTPTAACSRSAHTSTRCCTRSAGRAGHRGRQLTIELALDHNYTGLVVVAGDVKDGHTHDEVDAWFRDTYLPGRVAQSWGPDLVLDATTLPLLDDRPADVPPPAAGPNRFLQLHFLDHDPEEGWADGYAKIGQAINDSGLATHVWTGAFIPTDFGTDKYTDELW